MTASRRRAIGLFAVLIVLVGMSAYTTWRLQRAARQGWTGLSYIPTEPPKSPEKGRINFRIRERPAVGMFGPGSIVFLYPGAPAERAGIQWRDRVLSINGIPTHDFPRIARLSAETHAGDVITYRIARNSSERDVRVRLESPVGSTFFVVVFTTTIIVALTFLLIGLFVFWRRPADARAIVFFLMTLTATLSFVNGSLAQVDISNARGIIVQQSFVELGRILPIVVLGLFFAPLLLHLALIFPTDRPLMVQRRRTILTWIYGFPIYGTLMFGAVLAFGVALQQATAAKQKELLRLAGIGLLAVIGVLLIIALVRIVRRARVSGTKQALMQSPIATMTVLPALFAGMLFIAGLLTKRMQSPVPIFVLGIITVVAVCAALAMYPLATLITLFRSYRDSGVEERRQVKWPVWGTIVAVGGKLLLSIVGLVLGLMLSMGQLTRMHVSPVVLSAPDLLSKLLYVLIPLSFAFAILKYRLMNIDLIIRRTVLYSILTAVIFLLYAVLVAGLGTALVKFAGMTSQTMLIASTVVIALATVPIRNRLQRIVDRNLFRERRDYPLALRNIANAIATSGGIGAFLRLCAEQIQQALQNRLVVIALRREREFVAVAKVGLADEVLGTLRVPADTDLNALPEPFRKIGVTLAVPATSHRAVVGLLALGSKLSDEEFSAEDMEFLTSAASQLALGLENLRLRDEEAEFEQARAMQQILLPTRFPQLDGFSISGTWQPARSVGGDYFDTMSLGGGKAALCIADVAGKGMPAALLMANLQAAVKATASQEATPSSVCERVKGIVGGNLTGGKFISFFYGVLDANARTFTYSNAGHNPPILVRHDSSVERLARGGPAMCRLFQDLPHQQEMVTLGSGDRIVMFTDGASEARRGEEDFGEDRLIELVLLSRHLGARELQERIMEELRMFTRAILAMMSPWW